MHSVDWLLQLLISGVLIFRQICLLLTRRSRAERLSLIFLRFLFVHLVWSVIFMLASGLLELLVFISALQVALRLVLLMPQLVFPGLGLGA